jgi:hypothetical protein
MRRARRAAALALLRTRTRSAGRRPKRQGAAAGISGRKARRLHQDGLAAAHLAAAQHAATAAARSTQHPARRTPQQLRGPLLAEGCGWAYRQQPLSGEVQSAIRGTRHRCRSGSAAGEGRSSRAGGACAGTEPVLEVLPCAERESTEREGCFRCRLSACCQSGRAGAPRPAVCERDARGWSAARSLHAAERTLKKDARAGRPAADSGRRGACPSAGRGAGEGAARA